MQKNPRVILYIIVFLIIIIITGYIHGRQEVKQYINNTKETKHNNIIIETNKKIETETDKGVDAQAVEPVKLGNFKLTAYCPCSLCCGKWAANRPNDIVYGSIGEELQEGYSIAVDPNIIPYRTEVIINGNVYKAQDCGGAIKGNRIDVYFKNHEDALDFGVQYADVFIKL